MARKRDRIFALSMALLFLVTASTLTVMVIVDAVTNKDDQSSQQADLNILAGTKLENFTPVETVEELKTTDTAKGTGEVVKPGDTVTVDYTGAVAATGIIFESSKDSGQQATFGLDQVIKGWTEGIPGMQVGGTRRLVIPADMAYGATPPPGSPIPPNAALVFDVTLHAIQK